jgi:hypothetical protein
VAVPPSPARRAPAGRWARCLLIAAGGPILLAAHTLAFSASVDFAGLDAWRRLWTDLAVATTGWVEAVYGPAPGLVTARGDAADARGRQMLLERIERDGLRPTRPLATVRDRAFVRERLLPEPKPYDDKGRGMLLGLLFRLRGGIAPFLILWLGWLLAAPVLAWTAIELCGAGHGRAAVAWAVLAGLSPFVVETLALARYPVGFYLVALLLVVPLAVYACLHPAPTVGGLAARVAAAAALLALCVFCRSSAAVLLPGFLLAAGMGVRRVLAGRGRRLAALAAAAVLFAAPLPLVQGAQQNDVWQPIWEGLGDFDREKGYTWSDAAAEEAARRAGAPGLWTSESESAFRRQVLGDVTGDPVWFAGILVRRLAATVTLWKLWPWTPTDGLFIRRHSSENEGVIDKYWTYTTTIDYLGFGPWRIELPMPLVLAPGIALVLFGRRARWRPAASGFLRVLACVAVAALPVPVLVTTAGGQETQAFGLVYLLAAAFLVDLLPARSA